MKGGGGEEEGGGGGHKEGDLTWVQNRSEMRHECACV